MTVAMHSLGDAVGAMRVTLLHDSPLLLLLL